MTVTTIPSFGFARGAVVRRKSGGPNMLMVRCFGERSVVVVCEGDEDGTLRMRDVETASLELLLDAATPLDSG